MHRGPVSRSARRTGDTHLRSEGPHLTEVASKRLFAKVHDQVIHARLSVGRHSSPHAVGIALDAVLLRRWNLVHADGNP